MDKTERERGGGKNSAGRTNEEAVDDHDDDDDDDVDDGMMVSRLTRKERATHMTYVPMNTTHEEEAAAIHDPFISYEEERKVVVE